jgi:hypothetical protein
MAELIWTEQCERAWLFKEGSFADLLDVLKIPAIDRDLFCQLVGFPVHAEEAADMLRQQGKADSIPGFMVACERAWGTMGNALFMARLWLIHKDNRRGRNRCHAAPSVCKFSHSLKSASR